MERTIPEEHAHQPRLALRERNKVGIVGAGLVLDAEEDDIAAFASLITATANLSALTIENCGT